MTQDANPEHRPDVLWKDTLPNGHSAKLLVWPQKGRAFAVLRVNDEFHSAYQLAKHEQAIQEGLGAAPAGPGRAARPAQAPLFPC